MNAPRATLLALLILAIMGAAALAESPQDEIIVDRADTIRQATPGLDAGLLGSAAGIGPRVTVAFANTVRHFGLVDTPSALQGLLANVTPRITTDRANTIAHKPLVAVPADLQALFGQVSDRIVFAFANSSRHVPLSYPLQLIGDTTPPVVTNVAGAATGSTLEVTWTTNEFADSTVLYGTQSGNYTGTVNDPLFVRQHRIVVTGLTAGNTYYYRVRSTDLSGNTTTGPERSIVARSSIFLPQLRHGY